MIAMSRSVRANLISEARAIGGGIARLLVILCCFLSLAVQAVTRFTYISPESEQDPRTTYDRELLRLALEKTRDTFGDFGARPDHDQGQGSH